MVTELNRRGWTTKLWKTRKGNLRGGHLFTRSSLHRLLTNVTYIGRVRHKSQTHPGEHKAILTLEQWQRAQAILQQNKLHTSSVIGHKFGSLLKGLIFCVPCGCAMTPTHTKQTNGRRYRYYVCSKATQQGWKTCPSKAIPAAEMEQFVVDQIRIIGRDQALVRKTVEQMKLQCSEGLAALRNRATGVGSGSRLLEPGGGRNLAAPRSLQPWGHRDAGGGTVGGPQRPDPPGRGTRT